MSYRYGNKNKGQVILIFSILYITLLYILFNFAFDRGINIENPGSYIKLINLMIKRSVSSALTSHINGDNFLDCLNSNLNEICRFYPLMINISYYKVTIRNGFVEAYVNLNVRDFKFYSNYIFEYSCNIHLEIVNLTISRAYSPAFNEINVILRVNGDEDSIKKPPSFTISFSYNGNNIVFNPQVRSLDVVGYYDILFLLPINVHNFTITVVDWRGVKCDVYFKF
ncbi:MAG: hypothetical protein NZ926_00900 [Candidatus Methanomethylicia archaeon]|nr:hypothetical protein [Candidatus Methanomethylicia archaeon]MCX8168990.1 hypothetical protein [Candidatus Methanomethylicia archaeon]MDW7988721.1 hypothetical protein [Nitrososphaerota archaeon]